MGRPHAQLCFLPLSSKFGSHCHAKAPKAQDVRVKSGTWFRQFLVVFFQMQILHTSGFLQKILYFSMLENKDTCCVLCFSTCLILYTETALQPSRRGTPGWIPLPNPSAPISWWNSVKLHPVLYQLVGQEKSYIHPMFNSRASNIAT